MHSLLKKIASLFLLLLVAIPFIFSIFSFTKLAIIKYQVSKALESEQLQTITVAESDAKWIVPGKEILISNNLFDVKSCKRLQDKLRLTGLYDAEEDRSVEQLIKMLHQKKQENSTANTALINLLFQTLFTEKTTFFKPNIPVILSKKLPFSFTESLAAVNADILIPPPKA
jgi:uncharacterized membrane protein